MTYVVGGLIQAADYNGFVSTNSGANLNDIWGTGSGDKGWGQTALGSATAGDTVNATQWASLVNNLSSAGSQTNTTLTSRTVPTAGATIAILPAVNTDLTNVTTNRGNASVVGSEYGTFSGTTSQTSAVGSGTTAWTITWTHTITWDSANAARYFFNAGGRIKLQFNKSSTGTDIDADWNTFVGQAGTINITGGVNNTNQTIAGVAYSGTTRIGGTGGTQTILATTTGWYQLVAGAASTYIFQLNNATSPYTGEYILVTASKDPSSTSLVLGTSWYQPTVTGLGQTCNISGGTATTSPSTTITGTAPTTLCTYVPPSTTYLTSSWGTPTISASVSVS